MVAHQFPSVSFFSLFGTKHFFYKFLKAFLKLLSEVLFPVLRFDLWSCGLCKSVILNTLSSVCFFKKVLSREEIATQTTAYKIFVLSLFISSGNSW